MTIYRRVLKYYRGFFGATLLGLIFSLASIGLNLLKPWPLKIIVDWVIPRFSLGAHVKWPDAAPWWLQDAKKTCGWRRLPWLTTMRTICDTKWRRQRDQKPEVTAMASALWGGSCDTDFDGEWFSHAEETTATANQGIATYYKLAEMD